MTIKKALSILRKFKKDPFKYVMHFAIVEAMHTLNREDRCLYCGKKLKKIGKYRYRCSCSSKVIHKG